MTRYTRAEAEAAFVWLYRAAEHERHAAIVCSEIIRIWKAIEIRNAVDSRPAGFVAH